jgi:NTE family protein
VKPKAEPLSMKELRETYFRLTSDDNIKSIYPMLRYDTASGFYKLGLDVKRERDLRVQFGGNISTRPISEAFVGLQYNFWARNSLSINTGFYFGRTL